MIKITLRLVRSNVEDLYNNALKIGELSSVPNAIGQERITKSADNDEVHPKAMDEVEGR